MSLFPMPISEQIWDMKYRMKKADGTPIDLTVRDTWRRVAGALAMAEPEATRQRHETAFYDALQGFQFLPAGRIVAGAGTDRNVTLFNCFVMGTIPDSMAGIFDNLKDAALTMQQGGGIGYDFSTIRPKGAEVKGVAADASGPLTFMDCWDAMCRTVMSAGSRRGAMMATMRCDHPDIEAFIEAKKDPLKLRMFNLSVLVTDEFMEAVKARAPWRLHFEDRHGETLVEKTVDAAELWDKIMTSTFNQAEPGVIFIDRINKTNNLWNKEVIASTNPCGEQPLPPYGACLLGSINLTTLIENPFTRKAGLDSIRLKALVKTAIRMMDNVVDVSNFPLPQQQAEAKAKRRLGLGMTGLADALIMKGLVYGSPEAVEFTETVTKMIAVAAYEASVDLAIEKGPFPLFNADDYLKPGTFASNLPKELQDRIRKHGIRNSHLTSIAPTGTISLYAGNVSSGIEPVFALSYDRKVLQPDGSRTVETVEDYALFAYRQECEGNIEEFDPANLPPYFVSAQTLSPLDHVRMQAAAQKHVDSSISKTINCPVDISFEDFCEVYMAAWDAGCKGCTTYRPNDVTGSILSVKEEPAETTLDTIKRLTNGWLSVPDEAAKEARRKGLRKWLDDKGHQTVSEVPKGLWIELLDFQKTFPVADFSSFAKAMAAPVVTEAPLDRPDELDGKTYKLKWPGSGHSIYINITNIEEDGKLRPFEVFINSKNMEHFAWTVALTRMISAVFRRPHDSRFVVEELKAVFDPKGGAWLNGKYVPSILAAIGDVIEQHMRAIGYMEPAKGGTVQGVPEPARKVSMSPLLTAPYGEAAPPSCPTCGSFNVKKESGCFVCKDCGNSNCG